MRRSLYLVIFLLAIAPVLAAFVGKGIGGGILHPYRLPLNSERMEWANRMLKQTSARKEDFDVRAQDGIELRGWKVRSPASKGNWVLLYHGIADNRTGCSGHGEFLLRHGYSLVMMDSRAQGESGGDMATFGWKERAMQSIEKEGGFKPEDASPEKAVAARPFAVLLICGTRDHRIPCRHAERIYKAARGPKELWIVEGAEHASALGQSPAEYEARVIKLFETTANP
jgi:alpha-beta hydrolase superfamily lysophospholipase